MQIRFNCIEANELIVKLIESIQNVYLGTKRTRAVVNFICNQKITQNYLTKLISKKMGIVEHWHPKDTFPAS